jgi:putative acetyltransferase
VIIRAETPADPAAIGAVLVEAFGGEQEAALVEDLRQDGALTVSLVAEIEGRIVGHVALSALKSPLCALALAPLAVSTTRQRQGIGSALIRSAIDGAGVLGAKLIFILGDPNYYRRFGFTIETAAPFPSPYAGPYFMALKLTANDVAPEPVIYADAFDRLS